MSLKDRIKMPKLKSSKPRNLLALSAWNRGKQVFKDRRHEAHWEDEDWGEEFDEPMQFRRAV